MLTLVIRLQYADILVNGSGRAALFTYAIPLELADQIKEGSVVIVPLRQKKAFGIIWKIQTSDVRSQMSGKKYAIKPIIKIIHPDLQLLPYQKELAKWMADEFVAPLVDCAFSFLPILKKPPKELKSEIRNPSFDQSSGRPEPAERAKSETNSNDRNLKHLDLDIVSNLVLGASDLQSKLLLTDEQRNALKIIIESTKPVLLHGVTGSGKTELYLQYADAVLKQGKQVIILVPEIALTPQTKKRFVERFGDVVEVWHSELSAAERRAAYWAVRQGQKRLIVGSRSAIFLPTDNLGLVVIDEEHERSFYQESSPRYQTRVVAEKLCEITGAQLILGSATPSLESVWQASTGHYALARLTERVTKAAMPESVIVDLRQHRTFGDSSLISEPLHQYLNATLAAERQAVLLLNRRGSATAAVCTTCGTILLCKNCNVPMTIHLHGGAPLSNGVLQCHHCDRRVPLPALCPSCNSPTLNLRGFGTEKIQLELQQLFPEARILRMDRDTTSERAIIDTMYHDFAAHKYDILLGTQMIAKGWDIPSVDLVGILLAESGLLLPDFRAAEHTFSLLVQASGRSGRGNRPGKTIIQTYQPDHPLIHAAAAHDFGSFIKAELKTRRQFNYPPFSTVIRLLYQHHSQAKCRVETDALAHGITQTKIDGLTLLGPAPCFFDRLRGRYRFHIICKIENDQGVQALKKLVRPLKSPWVIECNPPQLL